MRPNLDPPPPPKEDRGLVSSRAGYAFANLEGFLCIRKFVLDFFGVSGGDEVTASARKSRKNLFQALLQSSLHPRTITLCTSSPKIKMVPINFKLICNTFCSTHFYIRFQRILFKGSISILDQELIFWTSKIEPADRSRIFYKLPYLCRQTPRRPWSSFRWISPHRPQGQGR